MTREEAIADFKEEVENGKSIVRAYKNNGLTIEHVERTIERDEMAISAMSEELSEDGTLTVHVSDGSKVSRVLVMGDNIFGGLYYPDSAENKGDLISRQAVLDELEKWDWQELYLPIHFKQILDDVPSVENEGEWISTEDRPNGFCSKCDRDMDETSTPYCPYCGAKMTWVGAVHKPYKKGE